MEPADLMIAGGTVITQNKEREIIDGGAVAIRGDSILAVGPADDLRVQYRAQRVLDASGRLVFPGLINTHTHLFQTFQKGLGEGLTAVRMGAGGHGAQRPLYDRPVMPIWPRYWAGWRRCTAGPRPCSITSIPCPDREMYRSVACAFRDLGLRGVLAQGLTETGEQFGLPAYLFQPVEEALVEWDALTAEIRGEMGYDLLQLWAGPGHCFWHYPGRPGEAARLCHRPEDAAQPARQRDGRR